jgi:ATP-dependent RNA helicase RhlE
VHRIGRTARAGSEGEAISLCDHEERDLLRAIEKLTRQAIATTDLRLAPGTRDSGAPEAAAPAPKKAGARPARPNGGRPARNPAPRREGERRRAAPPHGEGRSRDATTQAKHR